MQGPVLSQFTSISDIKWLKRCHFFPPMSANGLNVPPLKMVMTAVMAQVTVITGPLGLYRYISLVMGIV